MAEPWESKSFYRRFFMATAAAFVVAALAALVTVYIVRHVKNGHAAEPAPVAAPAD